MVLVSKLQYPIFNYTVSLIPPSLSSLHFRVDSFNSFLPSIQLLFPLLQAQKLRPLLKKYLEK